MSINQTKYKHNFIFGQMSFGQVYSGKCIRADKKYIYFFYSLENFIYN